MKLVSIEKIVKSFELSNYDKIELAKTLLIEVSLDADSDRLNEIITELKTWQNHS